MMKLSEKTKNFILYGIENKIERKEIYKFDGAILFLCFLAMFIADSTPSPSFYRIFLILFYVVFVIATFSKSDVTGEKTFWIHGIQGLGMSILFGWFGTILMFSTLEKEDYSSYMAILLIVYIISAIAYTCLVMFLIKKDIYNSDSNKKVMGGWSFVCFGMLGISVAKIMSSKIPYISMIRIAGLGFYVLSLLCLMSIIFFVKYFLIKKYKLKPNE